MAGWGFGEWGFTPWGGASPISTLCVPAGAQLQIVLRSPGPGEQNVPADKIVKIAFYDSTFSIDTSTIYVTLNGQAAVSGPNFLNGYNGMTAMNLGVFTVQILNPLGWEYESNYETFVHLKNTSGECLEDKWTWYTGLNPLCYTGLTPLDIEVGLQTPFNSLLEAEFFRGLLFNSLLKSTNKTITNYNLKAARALYQTAFSTELSTVQNLYVPRDEKALATTVCEREKLLVVDSRINEYRDFAKKLINSLENVQIFSKEYIATFHDYLNSTNYNFRVSLICNLVMVSKALEVRGLL